MKKNVVVNYKLNDFDHKGSGLNTLKIRVKRDGYNDTDLNVLILSSIDRENAEPSSKNYHRRENSVWENSLTDFGVAVGMKKETFEWKAIPEHEGYETTVIFEGCPSVLIEKIMTISKFDFDEVEFYFETRDKIGYTSYKGQDRFNAWTILKDKSEYFQKCYEMMKSLAVSKSKGQKMTHRFVENSGQRGLVKTNDGVYERVENELFLDLSPHFNLDD